MSPVRIALSRPFFRKTAAPSGCRSETLLPSRRRPRPRLSPTRQHATRRGGFSKSMDEARIEVLAPRHQRAAFDCGKAPLNTFLRQYAVVNAEQGSYSVPPGPFPYTALIHNPGAPHG